MSRFFAYDPDQAYSLPPSVKDVLGGEHLCFRLHVLVEQFDLSRFEQAYSAEGRLAYPPWLMLKVWLYAFCLGGNSTRGLERRIQEDLAFRYLAGLGKSRFRDPEHRRMRAKLRTADESFITDGSGSGTGVRDSERATRYKKVPETRAGCGTTVDAGHHRLQPDTHGDNHQAVKNARTKYFGR